MNEFLIGIKGPTVQFMRPVPRQLTREQALTLAAWIVALCDPTGQDFSKKLEEVQGC